MRGIIGADERDDLCRMAEQPRERELRGRRIPIVGLGFKGMVVPVLCSASVASDRVYLLR